MFNTSYSNVGTMLMDTSAIFLLAGVIVYTRLYRKRGRFDDRIYFSMLLVTILCGFFDLCNYALEESTWLLADKVITFGDTVFSICFVIWQYLFVLFLCFRVSRDEAKVKRAALPLCVPAAILSLVILGNLFGGYLFSVEYGTNIYTYGPLYDLIYVPFLIYGIVALFLFTRLKNRWTLIAFFLVLVFVRMALRQVLRDVSSTALIYALALVYAHVAVMNDSFYEEAELLPKGDKI